MVIAASIAAVVSQHFQANAHANAWLTFAIIWIACSLCAIGSSSLVYRVAEVRNRIIAQQRTRRPRR